MRLTGLSELQREQTWRHPCHITDHDQDRLERFLNDKTHSFTHIYESEYQIVHDMVCKFVNILNKKRKN